MAKIFITIIGPDFEHKSELLEKGMEIKLIKEPDNKYDSEAIRVEVKPLGTIGYVANSVRTVLGSCYSAGRLYDKIGKKAKAKIFIITPGCIIAVVNCTKTYK